MAEQSPTVEVAPTIIVSNSDEGIDNAASSGPPASTNTNGGNEEPSHSDGSPAHSGQELDGITQSLEGLAEQPIVAVAAIEAERDIELAEIHATTERERIAVEHEHIVAVVEDHKELEECRREIAELQEKVEALSLLIQPPQPVEVLEDQLEIAPEPNLIQPSTAAPMPEMLTELSEESEVEKLEPEIPVSRARRFVAI